ncbi:MAG: hypothetical protein F2837_03845 [Actinobacteria bacterium]|uniref:Unannotated protein n=1 Tax=freshwater metagenome TaxID=449393 RepID=A0A6J7IQ14_9ZZZZ|nr:hypothetical protein [Actinomycetota bacterium]
MTAPLSAPESARRVGTYCWLEQQAFACFGGWVTSLTDPVAKLTMLELGEHAAWRAQRWYELLPTAPPGADALVAGTAVLEAFVVALAPASEHEHSLEAFISAELVLELIDRSVADHLDRTTLLAEPALHRIAEIVRTDIAGDLVGCRAVLRASQGTLDRAAVDRLAGHRAALEALSPLELLTPS